MRVDYRDLMDADASLSHITPMRRSRSHCGTKCRSNRLHREAERRQRAKNAVASGDFTERDRGCASKRTYATRHRAECAARFLAEKHGHALRVYKCRYCSGWHLTSQADENEEQPCQET